MQQQEPAVQQQHEQQSAAGAAAAALNSNRRTMRDKSHTGGGVVATEMTNGERTRAARTAAAATRVADAAAAAIRATAAAGGAPERTAEAAGAAAFLSRRPCSSSEANPVVAQADAIYAAAAELAAAAAEGLRKRPPFPSEAAAAADYPPPSHRSDAAAAAAAAVADEAAAFAALAASSGRRGSAAGAAAEAAEAATEGTGSGWDTAGAVARLLLSLPVRGLQLLLHFIVGVFRRIASALSLMSSALLLSPPPPFVEMYEKDFGDKHPVFFSGTLPEAVDAARRGERLLVLYFHCMRSSAGDRFCTDVLTDDLVIELLNHSSIFYAVDAAYSSEASRLLRAFFPANPRSLPALAILLPPAMGGSGGSTGAVAASHTPPNSASATSSSSTSSSASFSSSLESRSGGPAGGAAAAARAGGGGGGGGRRSQPQHVHLRTRWMLQGLQGAAVGNVEELVAALVRAQEKNDEAKEQRARHLREVETNRRLREEQEREFEEVVRQERLKAQQLQEQRVAAEKRRQQQEEQQKQQERRKEERKATAEKIRQLFKEEELALSGADSAANTEGTLTVSLRLSSGARFCRRFRATASLEDLYSWADCLGELSGRPEVVIPWRFDLVVPPKQVLSRVSKCSCSSRTAEQRQLTQGSSSRDDRTTTYDDSRSAVSSRAGAL